MTTFFAGARKLAQRVAMGALLGGALAAVAATPATAPLATLSGGEAVSEADFNAYLARRVDLKPLVRNAWGAENALREMLTTRVLVLEGQRLKEPGPKEGAQPERFDDAYGFGIYQKLAKVCTKSEDAASVRKFYNEHPEAFTAPASVRLARVMLPVSDKVDGQASMGWLMAQAQEVASGAKGFEQVASKAATVYKLEPQGDLGWVNLTDEAPIMRALASAKPGEMVGPVREGDFGYLFLLGDKREARRMRWEEVQTSAANRQLSYCRQQANKELTSKLFKQYGVTIHNDAVRALFQAPAASSSASGPAAPAAARK